MAELLGVCTCNAPPQMEHLKSCSIWENGRPLGRQWERCSSVSPRGNPCQCFVGHTRSHEWSVGNNQEVWPQKASKPDMSAERKAAPLWSGCMSYFPLALLAVARLSKKANEKHNPGEPLHWSREKSNDHLDCAARHLLNPEEIDPEFNEPHAVAHAWRALAVLQLIEEKRLGNIK